MDDAVAICNMGIAYLEGMYGLQRNMKKGVELIVRAAELGSPLAYSCLMTYYLDGINGFEKNTTKFVYYAELAAKGGNLRARHNLGLYMARCGDLFSAARHLEISARGGEEESLETIRKSLLATDLISEEQYSEIERAHKATLDSMSSDNREKAQRCGYDFETYCLASLEELEEEAKAIAEAAANAR